MGYKILYTPFIPFHTHYTPLPRVLGVGSYNKCLFIASYLFFKGIHEPKMMFGYRLTSFFGFITFLEESF